MLTEWIKIIGLAIQLFHKTDCSENTSVVLQWDNLDRMGLRTVAEVNALYVTLETADDHKSICRYIFIPWQDIYQKHSSADIAPVTMFYELVTVNEFAIVYKDNSFSEIPDKYQQDAGRLRDFVEKLISCSTNQNIIEQQDGVTTSEGIQLISLKEYPFYSIQEVAISGSAAVRPDIKEPLKTGKMLYHILVPDEGQVKSSWIYTGSSISDNCFASNEKNFAEIVAGILNECIAKTSERDYLCEVARNRIDSIYESCSEKGSTGEMLQKFLKKCLNKVDVIYFEPGYDMFPDYQPKLTPDLATEYMGGLYDDFEKLPKADTGNIRELIKLFKKYRKLAKQNPGKWEEGNMILGARPKEYNPSKEELLLDEVGERIRQLIEKCMPESLAVKTEARMPGKISYRHFTFTHADVMGSGRFFYVDQIQEISLKLK